MMAIISFQLLKFQDVKFYWSWVLVLGQGYVLIIVLINNKKKLKSCCEDDYSILITILTIFVEKAIHI